MPKKITKIRFYNYKAFYSTTDDAYTIDLDKGKNLLIYGENGSGKSSIFDGLKDFFLSSEKDIEFNQNIFSKGSIPLEPYIEVEFTDEAQPFSFSTDEYKTNTKTSTFIKDVNKVRAFISYKELLKTHFVVSPPSELNLFPLLFEEGGILANIKSPLLDIGAGSNSTFYEYWHKLKALAFPIPDNYGLVIDRPTELSSGLDLYVSVINKYLEDIKVLINLFVEYFDKQLVIDEIKITINSSGPVSSEDYMKAKIIPKLKFYKTDVPSYNLFLNEARLTAMAISIYFAAIESNPINQYQILFLDDIFIGLDTSNRIPLLKIINENLISKYQIIITTYDKYWFEIAKNQLGDKNWHTAEMFVKSNTNNFQPIIIQPSKDYYALAKKHFDANDYPACGNYQRKACENIIRGFIPRKDQLQYNHDETVIEVDLETLFSKLKKYITEVGLDFTPFIDYSLYKRLVLNKLSHDDLKSPYYKSELEDMFIMLDQLIKLKRVVILNTDDFIYFETTDTTGNTIVIDIKAKDNLVLLKQDSIKKFQKCPFTTINKRTNSIREDFSNDGELKEIYAIICRHLNITPEQDIYSQFRDKNGKMLSSF